MPAIFVIPPVLTGYFLPGTGTRPSMVMERYAKGYINEEKVKTLLLPDSGPVIFVKKSDFDHRIQSSKLSYRVAVHFDRPMTYFSSVFKTV